MPIGIDLGDHHAFRAAAGDLAGRRDREAEPRDIGAVLAGVFGVPALASRWFGSSPSAIEKVFSSPLRQTVSFAVAPGAMAPICLARSCASLTGAPLTAVITSPARMPALAAGPFVLRIGDHRALRPLQAEIVGDARQ